MNDRYTATFRTGLALLLASLCLTLGCQGRGPGTRTTVGGLGGAAAGGLLGAALGGEEEAIAAGTLLGGLLGAGVGNYLDQRDRRLMAETTYEALENAPAGHTRTWTNPDTGHEGYVTPTETRRTDEGRTCREFRQTVEIDAREEVAYGTACRQPDGTWRIVS